jgi:hypothetical protein
MILRGRTPHSLGRGAALVVLALAVLLLPLVPGLGQAQQEEKKATREFGGALAKQPNPADDLGKARDALKQKLAEVEALKKKIEELAVAERQKAADREQARGRAVQGGQLKHLRETRSTATARGGVVVRIEISGLSGKPEEITALVKDLEKILGGKDKKVVIVQDRATVLQARGLAPVQVQPGVRWVVPAARQPGKVPAGQPGAGWEVVPAGKPPSAAGPGNVEKKVDALLKELEALRSELKELRKSAK